MAEPSTDSLVTARDRQSQRPTKRRALSPTSTQAAQLDALFAQPDREIKIPDASTLNAPKTLAPPPEIVQNVQGSSAGAGSGEFHVYKASRRREYERLRLMDEESKKEKDEEEFVRAQEERRKGDDEKTRKNREKREKAKKRKMRGKEKGSTPVGDADGDGKVDGGRERKFVKGPRPVVGTAGGEKEEDQNGDSHEGGNGEVVANAEEIGIIIHDDD